MTTTSHQCHWTGSVQLHHLGMLQSSPRKDLLLLIQGVVYSNHSAASKRSGDEILAHHLLRSLMEQPWQPHGSHGSHGANLMRKQLLLPRLLLQSTAKMLAHRSWLPRNSQLTRR